jgi:hypothetical protein
VEETEESPLEREELTLPDGRRLLLYTAAEEAGRSPAVHARQDAESQHQDAGRDAPRR